MFEDKTIICTECHQPFIFTAGEQAFFNDKGLQNEPKRCKPCKLRKNERFNAILGLKQRSRRSDISIDCADCGATTTVPFLPTQGRPVYCRDCFSKHRQRALIAQA
ncbi:MAG: zinc-ribbon domain containing protein [Candidatus Bathyarchaeia archaeon]